MKEEILKVKEEIQKLIEESKTLQKLEEIRVNYMGKKGIFTDLSKKMNVNPIRLEFSSFFSPI